MHFFYYHRFCCYMEGVPKKIMGDEHPTAGIYTGVVRANTSKEESRNKL